MISVIIPAFRAEATLPLVLDALAPQVAALDAEVIVVDSTGDDVAGRLTAWPWVTVVAPAQRMLPGPARNLGVARASADVLAFIDADAVPDSDWLSTLLAALEPDADAVAGAVRNGTPRSAVGTAGWLLEFSEFLPYRRRPVRHGASCNLLVRRAALEELGGFPDLWCGEDTIVTFRFAQRGGLAFERDATVRHLNRTALASFLRHQRRLGAGFAAVCDSVPFPHRWAARPPWSAVAGLVRIGALALRLSRRPTDLGRALLLSPLLVAGLASWTVGLVTRRV